MRRTTPLVEYAELTALFLFQAAATSMWFVPLSIILDANGLRSLTPFAFSAAATAAFISPLIFGAMADRHVSPVKVLRGLCIAAAVAMVLVSISIQLGWNRWIVLGFIQLQALFTTPTGSIATAIVFSRLRDTQNEFGPVRAGATFGWMVGCWVVSALDADGSIRTGYMDAGMWLVVAGFTYFLPSVDPPKSSERLTLKQRMGWDALRLMKNHDHRVVFITIALFYIPLSAFYPFTPPQLRDLGLRHTSAWMTLGQATEIVAMFSLAALLARWRLKWIFATGLGFAVLRFALCSVNGKAGVLAGVAMHGFSLVMVLITAQVYIDQRVDPTWRVRAQALVYLMTVGVGNLLGFLATGWWFNANTGYEGTHWPIFWGVLSAGEAVVLSYFLLAYHGKGMPPRNSPA